MATSGKTRRNQLNFQERQLSFRSVKGESRDKEITQFSIRVVKYSGYIIRKGTRKLVMLLNEDQPALEKIEIPFLFVCPFLHCRLRLQHGYKSGSVIKVCFVKGISMLANMIN